MDCFKENHVNSVDSEFMQQALTYGIAYELLYISSDGKKCFKNISPENMVVIYDNTLDEKMRYAIHFYEQVSWDDETPRYTVNVYDDTSIYHYETTDFESFVPVGNAERHYFSDIPVVCFMLHKNKIESVFGCVMDLMDSYSSILSDLCNSYENFADCYMVISGARGMEIDDVGQMKEARVILSPEDMDVSYLTKDNTNSQGMEILEELNKSIFSISCACDFASTEFAAATASSGISLSYKLISFSNRAAGFEQQLRSALMQRIRLLNNVFALTSENTTDEIQIDVTYNLPANVADLANTCNSLRGLLSDSTLISQIPWVESVDDELDKKQAEYEANVNIGEFNMHGGDEND